jgi:hypothetical protein
VIVRDDAGIIWALLLELQMQTGGKAIALRRPPSILC